MMWNRGRYAWVLGSVVFLGGLTLTRAAQQEQKEEGILIRTPPCFYAEMQRESTMGESATIRLWYDHGKFREETILAGGYQRIRLYNRDGQGIDFDYDPQRKFASLGLAGVMHRMSAEQRTQWAELLGSRDHPPTVSQIARRPFPEPEAQEVPWGMMRATSPSRPGGFLLQGWQWVGTDQVAGRPCSIYQTHRQSKTTVNEADGSQRMAVFQSLARIWVSAVDHLVLKREDTIKISGWPQIKQSLTILKLQIDPKIPPDLFELPPGTTAKVAADLRVRLPQGVQREEYPGCGFDFGPLQKKEGPK